MRSAETVGDRWTDGAASVVIGGHDHPPICMPSAAVRSPSNVATSACAPFKQGNAQEREGERQDGGWLRRINEFKNCARVESATFIRGAKKVAVRIHHEAGKWAAADRMRCPLPRTLPPTHPFAPCVPKSLSK